MDARIKIEARKRLLLRAVERALFDALADSSEVHRSLWRLQRAGYTLRVNVECAEERKEGEPALQEGGEPAARRRPPVAVSRRRMVSVRRPRG